MLEEINEELNRKEYLNKKKIAFLKKKYLDSYTRYKKFTYIFSCKAWKCKCVYKNLEKRAKKKNEIFLKEEDKKYDALFSNINGRSLDKEQRIAVLQEEDSSLVIAGAGSGKTLTMLGKIVYLLKVKQVEASKILCISFTNAITQDFKTSLKKVTEEKIDCMTFHKLGISIFHYNGLDVEIAEETFLKVILLRWIEKIDLTFFFKENKGKKELFLNLVSTFIHLFKAGGYEKESFLLFMEEAKKNKNRFLRKKELLFLDFTYKVYTTYQEELEKENKIDFDDMIKEATSLLLHGGSYKKYDYILIDEYQDTSYIRYQLVKALKEMGMSKVIAVGDDWQAIYKFTGCTLDNFLNFEQLFPYSSIFKIQTTYRNPQELITVAGKFVMKNKKQIYKELHSQKRVKKPIKIFFYKQKRDFIYFLDQIISKNKSDAYYILGRNNHDIEFLRNYDEFLIENNEIQYQKHPNISFYFYTVHKSKGLESENVILINMEDSILGFPSQLTEDALLRYVTKKENYPYEEERRLFYVALTRTKNNVYLFCPSSQCSIFVKELLEENKKDIEIIKYKTENLEEAKDVVY